MRWSYGLLQYLRSHQRSPISNLKISCGIDAYNGARQSNFVTQGEGRNEASWVGVAVWNSSGCSCGHVFVIGVVMLPLQRDLQRREVSRLEIPSSYILK